MIDEMIQSNQQTFKYKTKMKCPESCFFLGTLLFELKIRLLYKKNIKANKYTLMFIKQF
ncbi:hypothetical protein RV03_GL000165 [Enterococcus gallinarum]|nr:hypothetical protein RV03_GL000165 [Enterococcus gallinarum]